MVTNKLQIFESMFEKYSFSFHFIECWRFVSWFIRLLIFSISVQFFLLSLFFLLDLSWKMLKVETSSKYHQLLHFFWKLFFFQLFYCKSYAWRYCWYDFKSLRYLPKCVWYFQISFSIPTFSLSSLLCNQWRLKISGTNKPQIIRSFIVAVTIHKKGIFQEIRPFYPHLLEHQQ